MVLLQGHYDHCVGVIHKHFKLKLSTHEMEQYFQTYSENPLFHFLGLKLLIFLKRTQYSTPNALTISLTGLNSFMPKFVPQIFDPFQWVV